MDEGVHEVVGFLLMLVISSVVLGVSLKVFGEARENARNLVSAVEFRSVADRIASRVVLAGIQAQDFPNSSLSLPLTIPTSIDGKTYRIQATRGRIYVNGTSGEVRVNSTTFKLDALTGLQLYVEDPREDALHSEEGGLVISYLSPYTCPPYAVPPRKPCTSGVPTIVLRSG